MITEADEKIAKDLLDELASLSPEQLPNWNMKAQTFLVFLAIKEIDEGELNSIINF